MNCQYQIKEAGFTAYRCVTEEQYSHYVQDWEQGHVSFGWVLTVLMIAFVGILVKYLKVLDR